MSEPFTTYKALRDFTEKVGPIVANTPASSVLKCTRCKYLKVVLIRSGRDPQWESKCTHPGCMHNGYVGGGDCETPAYCPELKANKEAGKLNTCPKCYASYDSCQCESEGGS